jgi:hypothetical protein
MKKKRQGLDTWMDMPEDMKKSLQNYDYHFNRKIYKFAVSKMFKKNKDGREEKIEPVEKEKVHEILKKYNQQNGEVDKAMKLIDEAYNYRLKHRSFIEDIRGL